MPRWYKGFRCGGIKPTVLLRNIAEYVKVHDLGHFIPLVRVEKHARGGGFYVFLAIESAEIGQIPERVQSIISQKWLGQPLDPPFSFAEIRKMVGAEHLVNDYVRLLPYERSPAFPSADPFDDVEEATQTSHLPSHVMRTQQYDRLILWMSAIGRGSWLALQQTWQRLGESDHAAQMLRYLRLLGHIETSLDRKRWAITPSVVFPITHGVHAGDWVLSGRRDTALLQQLQESVNLVFVPQEYGNGPATIYLRSFDDKQVFDKLKSIDRITIQPEQAGVRLARLLPPLEQWKASLEALQGVRPHAYRTKIFNGKTFVEISFDGKRGLYEFWSLSDHALKQADLRPQYTLYFDEDTQRWVRADWYGLRFLARYETGQSCPIQYHATTHQLAVPNKWRWPELYERALVLASGRMPLYRNGWLIYDGISRELIDGLRDKLRLEIEELTNA